VRVPRTVSDDPGYLLGGPADESQCLSAIPAEARTGTIAEVSAAFLKLGLTSFGGPIAHLAYFREEFVVRRGWLDDAGYGELVALAQFIPGPASSQVGMVLGYARAGWGGALAAWLAFTAPSALLMFAAAVGLAHLGGAAISGALAGLKLFAVGVVALAVWGMARTLTPDAVRLAIALAAAATLLLMPTAAWQIAVIATAGLAGALSLRLPTGQRPALPSASPGVRAGAIALLAFMVLLVALPLAAASWPVAAVQLFDSFFRAGALVFGGGHVVLPLLHAELVPAGWISDEAFLAGYALAQAVPGPLFTFATYAGAAAQPEARVSGAAIATVAIFAPAFLLVFGALPFWQRELQRAWARRAVAGASAGVVGVLLAALITPVASTAIHSLTDAAIATLIVALLASRRVPVWAIAAAAASGGGLLASVAR
jgi:chromate transporter